MANLQAGGLKSIGMHKGISGASNDIITEEWKRVQPLKLNVLRSDPHLPSIEAPPRATIMDLPLMPGPSHSTYTKHLIDIIPDWKGTVDKTVVKNLVTLGQYQNLPEPFKPKSDWEVAYTMQIHAVQKTEDTWDVVKWYRLDDKQTTTAAIGHLCVGEAFTPQWIPKDPLTTFKVLHAVLERLGGMQILFASWQSKEQSKELRDTTKIKQGYAYIRIKGPKSNNRGQFQEWTDVEVNTESSPICGWPEGKVKEYLNTLLRGRTTAKTIDFWGFTYKDMEPWFFDSVMVRVIGSHQEFGILWGGLPNSGKSMGSKTHGMHVSEFHIAKDERDDLVPSIVTAKNVDFFRGEPNTVYKPAVGDDWQMKTMKIEDTKAFFYPAEEDALLWARWGGSGFDMNACRQGCTNATNAAAEVQMGAETKIRFEHFLQMISPSLPKDAEHDDIVAQLRRHHTVWITNYGVYFRPASAEQTLVTRLPWPDKAHKDIFKKEVREWVHTYKNGSRELRPCFQEDRRWSLAVVQKLTRGETIPRTITILGSTALGRDSLFAATEYRHPPLAPDAQMPVERLAEPSAGASAGHLGVAAPRDCGCTLEDRAEVQKILHVAAKKLHGTVVDVTSPVRPSRGFCGDHDDYRAVQEIFWENAKAAHGSYINLADSPATSPAPKRHKRSDTEDSFAADLEAEAEAMVAAGRAAEEDEGNPLGQSLGLDALPSQTMDVD